MLKNNFHAQEDLNVWFNDYYVSQYEGPHCPILLPFTNPYLLQFVFFSPHMPWTELRFVRNRKNHKYFHSSKKWKYNRRHGKCINSYKHDRKQQCYLRVPSLFVKCFMLVFLLSTYYLHSAKPFSWTSWFSHNSGVGYTITWGSEVKLLEKKKMFWWDWYLNSGTLTPEPMTPTSTKDGLSQRIWTLVISMKPF